MGGGSGCGVSSGCRLLGRAKDVGGWGPAMGLPEVKEVACEDLWRCGIRGGAAAVRDSCTDLDEE